VKLSGSTRLEVAGVEGLIGRHQDLPRLLPRGLRLRSWNGGTVLIWAAERPERDALVLPPGVELASVPRLLDGRPLENVVKSGR
jgi:hypothetical protein